MEWCENATFTQNESFSQAFLLILTTDHSNFDLMDYWNNYADSHVSLGEIKCWRWENLFTNWAYDLGVVVPFPSRF